MSELTERLKTDFREPEFRHVYADESLNTYIATQIKVLREQREWTQAELAERCQMRQSRISVMEDIDYSSWSINTLRRLAQAYDLRLSVKFESFGSLLPELEDFSQARLEQPSFDNDPAFSDATTVRSTAAHWANIVELFTARPTATTWKVEDTAAKITDRMHSTDSTASTARRANA